MIITNETKIHQKHFVDTLMKAKIKRFKSIAKYKAKKPCAHTWYTRLLDNGENSRKIIAKSTSLQTQTRVT